MCVYSIYIYIYMCVCDTHEAFVREFPFIVSGACFDGHQFERHGILPGF